jgi:hypothetical protein
MGAAGPSARTANSPPEQPGRREQSAEEVQAIEREMHRVGQSATGWNDD